MQALLIPAVLDKIVRQPIEQFRVRWLITCDAKVARSRDQTAAEVVHPDTVHEHARSQRVRPVSQVTRVGESATRGLVLRIIDRHCQLRAVSAQHHQLSRFHRLARALGISTEENLAHRDLTCGLGRRHHHAQRRLPGPDLSHLFLLLLELPERRPIILH